MLRRAASWTSLRSREQKLRLFFELLQPRPETTVLDVGVTDAPFGAGSTDNFFEARYPWPWQITAVGDTGLDRFRVAFPAVRAVHADGRALPFADGEFELASAIEVLEHVPDPEHTVAEMARCASAHLLVSVPREPMWRMLNMARGAYLSDLGNTPGHLNHWSKRSFVRMLERHGQVVQARSPFPWTMLLVRIG